MNTVRRTGTNAVRWLFKPRGIVAVSTGFVVLTLLLNLIVRFFRKNVIRFDWPVFWPLGMFLPRRPAAYQTAMAIVLLILVYFLVRRLQRSAYNLWYVIGMAVVLVIATNLLLGWEGGFVTPIAGGGTRGIQCYHDAIKVESAAEFVQSFNEIQPELLTHSRTHPPGAVLSFYLLHRITGSPAAIALVIACLSTVLSLLFFHGIVARDLGGGNLPRYITFLYALIPAVQVYYAASIDALIAALLLGAVYFFTYRRTAIGIAGSCVCIFLASFMTFGFLFVLPVIVITEFIQTRRPVRSGTTIALLGVIYAVMYGTLGFNYPAAFRTAAALENPNGFMLFVDPASYVFTRLEGIFEIVVFFGPFLLIIAFRGLRVMRRAGTNLFTMTAIALATLAAMFLTGAFRTGETARACLFVYPYLLFPVVWYMKRNAFTHYEEGMLLLVVFIQGVCMQLFGNYFW